MALHLLKRGVDSPVSFRIDERREQLAAVPSAAPPTSSAGSGPSCVIRDLAEGRTRFCELERSLEGISPRTLSLRLRALEEEGIVARNTYPEVPPRVEYALTEKGEALVPLIEDMRRYGSAGCSGRGGAARPPPSSPSAASHRARAGGPDRGRKPGPCAISCSTKRSSGSPPRPRRGSARSSPGGIRSRSTSRRVSGDDSAFSTATCR